MKPRDQLIKASEHLHYEIWMLRLTAFLVSGLPTGTTEPPEDDDDLVFLTSVSHTTHIEPSIYSSNAPLTPPSSPEHDAAVGNAVLEAFAIHLRALLDFFYISPKRAKRDDVLAEHFYPNPEQWRRARPKLTEQKIIEVKSRVSKEVAHLTYERNKISGVEWEWPILEYKQLVLQALQVFLDTVNGEFLSSRWND